MTMLARRRTSIVGTAIACKLLTYAWHLRSEAERSQPPPPDR
jgi:hypothetical protein